MIFLVFSVLAIAAAGFYYVGVIVGLKSHLKHDCGLMLRNLGMMCREYAQEHDGKFPSTWKVLKPEDVGSNWERIFRCPSTDREPGKWEEVDAWSGYRLVTGRSTNDPPYTVLAFEPLTNHKTGANILFVNGATEWWSAAQIKAEKLPP